MAAHIRNAIPSRCLSWTSPVRKNRYSRCIATDSRNRLSRFWAPTGGITPQDGEQDDSHALLIRGGFLRQAHSGVFHLLPLGLRVQSKLESLIDKHMSSISASKVSLSSLTTETLWRQSGRYSANSELLRINDRKESGFLLSPTHEEEITALVASMVVSYKDVPLRLYQIGRKYRDERRPRQGLLRAKEFMMKDLYTFDADAESALATYKEVRQAYNNLFDELKLPYLVADADSGNMGGKLSHEYHFVSPKGEDNVWTCNSCSYAANEELVEKRPSPPSKVNNNTTTNPLIFTGISTDHTTAINIHMPRPPTLSPDSNASWTTISTHVNLHAVKRALPPTLDLDSGIENTTLLTLLPKTTSNLDIYDASLPTTTPPTNHLDLTPIPPSSPCPRCAHGTINPHRAIEIAHTFHLGTRYSAPLNALITPAHNNGTTKHALQMGCHGIGVSRIIGAVAGLLASERGLGWPRCIAPFEVVVVAGKGMEGVLDGVGDAITGGHGKGGGDVHVDVDVVLDDRVDKGLGWKLKDADLIGYPVVVVVGHGWRERGEVEVQCRRLGFKRDVGLDEVRGLVRVLLEQL
ncbi:prolyl-tRNA synthetase-like protein [Plenodomus tracheiphilus IPT5]|uniref:proline--tRNA ligase n=1 Tax=Plenodomus tracheiphilus IPT5 TaxID=1408161 RepID=A0A6A7BM87_9PLEO|nr:prolyl-tRNA synthetase-like protein [Plenodomus tracheiphilus IPT5]